MATIAPSYTVTTTGPIHSNPYGFFTRPANTTLYTVGDVVISTGSLPMLIQVGRVDAGSCRIERVKIHKSGTSVTNAQFRVHFFNEFIAVSSVDNAALAITGSTAHIGSADVTVSQAFSDGSTGFSDSTFKPINLKVDSGLSIYAVLEARGAYTPISSEYFRVSLDVVQG